MSRMRKMEVQEFLMAPGWDSGDEQRSLRVEGDGWILVVDAGEHGNVSVQVGDRSGSKLRSVFVVNEDRSGVVPLVEVWGPLQVRFQVDGAVDRLVGKSSRSDSPTKVLETAPTMMLEGSVEVREFAGEAKFAQVNGLLNCKGRHGPPGRLLSLDSCSGRVLGADITSLSPADLSNAQKLAVFEPDVGNLYDLAGRYDLFTRRVRNLLPWRPNLDAPTSEDRPTQVLAHWFRDLHATIGKQAVPASTRAAVRWCYALLEHQAMQGGGLRARVESLGRWMYRCVGYGHRPSRALASWAVSALLVTAASVFWRFFESPRHGAASASAKGSASDAAQVTESGIVERFLEALLAPIRAVLRLGSDGPATLLPHPVGNTLAYLAVGVPFLFFVIGLRQFFRSPLAAAKQD